MIDINSMINDIGVTAVIQRETSTIGGYTGNSTTWSTHLTVTVCLQNLTGKDIIAAQQKGVQATHRMYCNIADIKEKDRAYINSKYYQIAWVDNPMNMVKFLEILLDRSDNYGSASK